MPIDPTTDISGKVVWLRGKDLGSSGSSISTWTDQSGAGHNGVGFNASPVVATAATPSGGKAARFNHSGMSLGTLGLSTAAEMWIVVKASSTADAVAYAWKFGTDASASLNNYYPYSGVVYDDFGVTARQSFTPTASVGSWRLYRVKASAGNWSAWLDGTLQLSTSATVSFRTTSLLSASAGGGDGFVGDIAEVLVRNTVSTSGEVADLITYFNAEHGLTVPGGSSPSGPLAALAPSAVAAFAGLVTLAGSLSATAPAPTAAIVGTSQGVSGSITATAPSPAAAFAGIVTQSGTLDATAPTPVAAFTGHPVSVGVLSATAPAPTFLLYDMVDGLRALAPHPVAAFTGTVIAPLVIEPWTLDRSQLDLATITDVQGVALVDYPAAPIPGSLASRVRPLRRNSPILDVQDVTAGAIVKDGGYWRGDGTHEVIREDVGYLHVWVDGVDVTYWNDTVTEVGSVTSSTPGGEESLTLRFPWLTSLDYIQAPPHFWLRADVDVDVKLIDMEGVRHPIWSGHLVADSPRLDEGSDPQVWEAHGALTLADVQMHQQPIMMGPTDIGTVIPDELNAVVSRSYNPIPRVTTGIMTRSKGAASDTRWGYANGLLGTAWTEDERQWSIVRHASLPRTYRMQLRDEAVSWTLTSGAPGVSVDLTKDSTQRIDRVFGRGVGPDGYSWQNRKFPNLLAYAMPDYPFTNPSNVITVGTTDAGTDSGNGVTTWQRRMVEAGYAVAIDGVYSSSDASWARKIQKDAGISVDGVVGPQTWAATFDVGTTGADLNGSYRAPLFQLVAVTPNLYAANGKVTGENPDYDPLVKPKDREIDYGPGVTKVQATRWAVDLVQRSFEVGWVGTITLHGTDPAEGSKWFMREGQNVLLKHWRGNTDRPLHIVSVEHDFTSDTTTLRVDSKNRDALSAHEIYMRNKESAPDPARRPGTTDRRSRQEQDQVVPFEGESEAGYVYLPVNGDAGLWSVRPVFVSEIGQLVKVDLQTTPHREFAVALFGDEVTANDVAHWVGNPLTTEKAFDGMFDANGNPRHAYITSWGNKGEKAGHSPKGPTDPITGRLLDEQTVPYVSAKGGWVWVAVFAASSTIIEGRLYPAPVI